MAGIRRIEAAGAFALVCHEDRSSKDCLAVTNRIAFLTKQLHSMASELSRTTKQLILLGFDLAAIAIALTIALHAPRAKVATPGLTLLLIGVPLLSVLLCWVFGLYRTVVRSTGAHGPLAIGSVALITAGLLAVTNRLMPQTYVPADVIYRYCFYLLVLAGGGRLIARDLLRRSSPNMSKILVYGAGEAGRRLADALLSGRWRIVAFVDDDKQRQRATVRGIRVYSPARLPDLVQRLGVRQVLLAMPSLSRRRRGEIIEALLPLGVAVRTVPDLTDIVTGVARVDDLKDINVADILGRDPITPIDRLLDACVRDQNVLVTGAGGSIGAELSRQILRLGPRRLILLDISEHALYQVERELLAVAAVEKLTVEVIALLGNAHHKRRIRQILKIYEIASIYHAAAYKHVPIVESNIIEGVQNNVIGTWHMADSAIACGVRTFVLVSTDKAVNPTNVMGATKRMAEIVLQGLQQRGGVTRFCMVRFGNVLGSSGSVVPLFREQIRSGGPVTVTHPQVTRFFMTITEAVNLVLQAGSMGQGGDVFVLDMGKQVRIADLARRMIELSGLTVRDENHPDGDIEVEFTGLRPAEKLYEELIIGQNAHATEHPRILRAVEHALSWSDLEVLLGELVLALERFDCVSVLGILKRAVAEYQAVVEHFDLVDRAHGNARRTLASMEANITQLAAHRAN
jgi:FlaA1/EpsC-like NDP-sugar epimerase